ncbi:MULTISPECIES: RelA/SpoT family protein [unclassified Ancylobacter]|uniref:RelA/SpoT family protein n=1 Tax=unclassified Ancylobacter TaxID=2626613 RepID=UPI00226F320B|nr:MULTISPECIES: bifunctional (p)ppGpp synthetase/guanosine-3',5'-bis(diphosphate) 3'-pyrophosphohydrolase [unclassified Ancylobacter]WAC26491.1 bifunctional (p)ppGpp synthetase/guanosine-3',5'-bis(diphosphate) 3'-pyrophosphohydrolase [Ancylobacter sp. SL191]WGD31142.1 bifunctional (p)ppGpp synthetase/guanosine-3',5'-bis(diphosphate) 3'-pyrophosphohydrolase [Ancylobacter sp. WKF20]
MMRQYELVERVRRYNPNTDEALLDRAYVYAMRAHGTQKRASGDPYFSHPLEVAAILTDLKLDDATIVAALLHDTIEDTDTTRDEIDRIFGAQIGALVEGLTKIKKLDLVSKQAKQAENLRKLLLAIADDVRVLLVKLADRLHNMRTLKWVPEEKRSRVAQETLDIYAPLAGRMGMHDMREELEDLSFRQLSPEAYESIRSRLQALKESNGELVAAIERELTEAVTQKGIVANVKGREKRPYSIWRKMETKAVAFEQLSDIYGFRILVETLEQCYGALGIVHTKWPLVPGRFKDYISTPKQNDYRSIHTTVVGPGRQRVELQIRTRQMHEIAEYGIAAHALYKDASGVGDPMTRDSSAYAWLRRTIELLAEGSSPEEFLEHTKLELFHDQVFCFTPKGRLITLPRRATPIDFAYAVHTGVGDRAVGAKVNGRVSPLVSELHNGDEVEIITAAGQTPPAAWESIVVTGKARAAIRRATRAAVRAQYAGLGKKIVERAFARAGKVFSEEKLAGAVGRLARTSLEDVFAAVGRSEIRADDVVKSLHPEWTGPRPEERAAPQGEGWFELDKGQSLKFKIPGSEGDPDPATVIPIRGINRELPVRFAPNGGAVPGDRIVGILSPGEGITIYPIQSPALQDFEEEPERWLDVRWDVEGDNPQRFPVQIVVVATNEPGSLAQIAQVIGERDGNIDNVRMSSRSADFTRIVIDIGVYDLRHLNGIIADLRARAVVSSVERVNG